MNKKFPIKSMVVILAIIVVCLSVVGGTLSWLSDQTKPVVNTFTYGDINIDLNETPTNDGDENPDTNKYKMIPGEYILKDPKVTVKVDSEACWLFVKLEKSENFDDFMEYEVSEVWAQLKDEQGNNVEGVYFREVDKVTDEDKVYEVIKDNKVHVKESVTKEMLNALNPEDENTTYPTLTVTAYAVQKSGFEPEISEGANSPTEQQFNNAAFKSWSQTNG